MNFISVEFALGFLLLFPLYWVLQPWPRTQNLLLTVVGLVLLWLYASGVAVAVLFLYRRDPSLRTFQHDISFQSDKIILVVVRGCWFDRAPWGLEVQ